MVCQPLLDAREGVRMRSDKAFDLLFCQIIAIPVMRGVADLVESRDELVKLVLLETDGQSNGMVRRCPSIELPTSRHCCPSVPYLELIPSPHKRF
jgi:hypothetical protein